MTKKDERVAEAVVAFLSGLYKGRIPKGVVDLIREGDYESASRLFRDRGLVKLICDESPHADRTSIERLLRDGNFDSFLDKIQNPLETNVTNAALLLLGSVLEYKPRNIRAVICKTTAWDYVGGSDQTTTQAKPGTIGVYHADKMGGYDIALISAHERGRNGAVAIWEIRYLDGERLGPKISVKSRIADELGFSRTSGKNILNSKTPLTLNFDTNIYLRDFAKVRRDIVDEPAGYAGCFVLEKVSRVR